MLIAKITELENKIISNKLGSDSQEYTDMEYFTNKLLHKELVLENRLDLTDTKNLVDVTELVINKIKQGYSIESACEMSGTEKTTFYDSISCGQAKQINRIINNLNK